MKLLDYLDKGGFIMYILAFLSVLGMSILVWKLILLLQARKKTDAVATDIFENAKDHSNQYIKDTLSLYIIRLEKGLETVKTIASVAPLLGLLGTVLGILDSFEKIANKGMDASYFASGISLALITTIGGLLVAIPNIIGYNYLIKLLDTTEIKINQHLALKLKGAKKSKEQIKGNI